MKYILLILTIIFSACSVKNYEQVQSKIIIIKSSKLKFADLGYLRNTKNAIELELFVAGKVVEKFSINHLVCVSEGCMSKRNFNEKYLNAAYPDELLQNILLSKEIFDGKNRIKTLDGFEQNIENNDVNISYRVSTKSMEFKDRKNRIIFKIRDVN